MKWVNQIYELYVVHNQLSSNWWYIISIVILYSAFINKTIIKFENNGLHSKSNIYGMNKKLNPTIEY
jgi:hypothetical protein